MKTIYHVFKGHSVFSRSIVLPAVLSSCLLASFSEVGLSAQKPVEYKYINRDGTQVVGNYNKVNVTYIYAPRGYKEIADNSIVGKFQTVNGNFVSRMRGVRQLVFNKDGTYKYYEQDKSKKKFVLVNSGVYRVGTDPWRKGARKVAVLENAGPLWVRIDSKNRINYAQMNYDRI